MDIITNPRLEPPEKSRMVRLVECPHSACGAQPTEPCRTADGSPTTRSHDERYGRLHVLVDQYEDFITAQREEAFDSGMELGAQLCTRCAPGADPTQ